MYSGRHYGIETAFEQYEEETGVNVEFLTGNDAELRERIAAEGEDTEADVYLTVDAGNLWRRRRGRPVPADRLGRSSTRRSRPSYRDPEDRWFGLAVRTRTIVYNTDLDRRGRRARPPTRSSPSPSGRAGCACATPATTTSSRWWPA